MLPATSVYAYLWLPFFFISESGSQLAHYVAQDDLELTDLSTFLWLLCGITATGLTFISLVYILGSRSVGSHDNIYLAFVFFKKA